MTNTDHPAPECPARVCLSDPSFAADPHRVYAALREQAPVARVDLAPGVPATLVLDHRTALSVLHDPATFRKDSRRWLQHAPTDSPLVPMMSYRENVLFQDGPEHERLRQAITDSFRRVDSITLRGHVTESAEALIGEFATSGRADLLTQYARRLPVLVLNRLFGSPAELTDRMVTAITALWDGTDVEQANDELARCMVELIAVKRHAPAADITSWLLAHPAGLTDEEMLHQLIVLVGAGAEPMQNLIANALRLWLADERFAGDLSGGRLPVEDALDEVLWQDPPLANYAITYPVDDVELAGYHLPADEPVVISFAAANTGLAGDFTRRDGNRAHLAWSAGDHMCPARSPARLIASVAIETILDSLPDMELAVPAVELEWRPGPFHRALRALPVRFPIRDADSHGDVTPWNSRPVRTP